MKDVSTVKQAIENNGFTIIETIFSADEVDRILNIIHQASHNSNTTFRKTADLFAIRQFLKEVPDINSILFTSSFSNTIKALFGDGYFVVKSIYFDKPSQSNWFVSYHQDLTISVNTKADTAGFINWTVKQNQFAVQPPMALLQDNFTVRIHLDDTGEQNGALRVIAGSHNKGIYKADELKTNEQETNCVVKRGGIMIMRPLLLHASGRTTNGQPRRVIHIEFSRQQLPAPLQWAEYRSLPTHASPIQ